MLKPDIGLPGRIPHRTRGGYLSISVIVLFLVLCAAGAVGLLYLQQQNQGRASSDRPIVLVTYPLPGSAAAVGRVVFVSATAYGSSPIRRVELWMDGELKQTQESARAEGDSTFYAHFSLAVSEGPHILSARAVDTAGLIGNSLPVSVVGRLDSTAQTLNVPIIEGSTLGDIAKDFGTDPGTLQAMNPSLGSQMPLPGTMITVPIPPKQSPLSPPAELPPGSIPVPIPSPPSPVVTGTAPIPSGPMLTELKVVGIVPALLGSLANPSPPGAPKDLKGQVVGCDVILHWNDISDNEERYEVWTALGMLSPQLVASLSPSPAKGPAWYKFFAPQTGWVTFWVEAVNPNGKQPSNDIGLFIDPQKCAWTAASEKYLIVQVFEMTLKGNYDKVYCYVSYEGNAERRIPENAISGLLSPGDYIEVKQGKANFGGTTVGEEGKIFAKLIPIPQDGALDVEGRCLGWSGQTLSGLGLFAGKYTVNDWDGARRSVKSANYEIEFAIKPWSPAVETAAMGKYSYEDPTLPAPYDVSTSGVLAIGGKVDPRERALSWKWHGDPKRITGFQVYVDGIPYGYVGGANTRQALVQSASYCGKQVRWEVAAVSGLAQSPKSPAHVYNLSACQLFAEVKFDTIYVMCVDNAWFSYQCSPGGKPNCDTIYPTSMTLFVNELTHRVWSESFPGALKCGMYSLSFPLVTSNAWDQTKKGKFETFIIPLWGANPSVRVATRLYYENKWGEPTMFQSSEHTFVMPLDKWKTFQGEIDLPWDFSNGVMSVVWGRIRGFEAYGR